ncbi:hypothetical protein PAXRUDRAFT_825409 [Paxillus rubicundulus Ve08.2h10]|uniref:Uncharacterized protein n=1 Tax=Paxillus rubicundulus Ve08.2h10 TaxID=930991 RepID=A0A0D0E696_9AGAM|nr:hypothetical protein PAXRUDRAFT_825409 [Paxillus rubicundulus Ve08.2h10]
MAWGTKMILERGRPCHTSDLSGLLAKPLTKQSGDPLIREVLRPQALEMSLDGVRGRGYEQRKRKQLRRLSVVKKQRVIG